MLFLGAVLHGALALGLHLWGRWLARRRPGPWSRRATWLPVVGLALVVAAVVLLAAGAIELGSEEESAPPVAFARTLSSAVNVTSVFLVPAWLCYLVSLGALVVGTVRGRARGR
ncbi:MAG: hypothetical protein HY908_21080 [Myxococcales bacterium]|nr:hypothetical protein [Myxococcales bacterium]